MNKTIKVLLFAPAYADKNDRTKQNHVHNALLSFREHGIEPTVVDLRPEREGIFREVFESIEVVRFGVLPVGWKRGLIFRAIFKKRMRRFLQENARDYDIIHLNTTLIQMLSPLRVVPSMPVVATCHGDEVYPSPNAATEEARRRLLHSCRAVTAVSDYTAALVRNYVGDSVPVYVIRNGIRADIFSAVLDKDKRQLRDSRQISNEAFVIFMACAMIERKGVLEVLDAFEIVAREKPEAILFCVGKGSLAEEFQRRIVEKRLPARIKYVPYIESDEEMANLYRLADLYIMLSKTVPNSQGAGVEGFGISYIDAGAVGIPVIGGNSGGVPSAVLDGETGYLVDPNSPDLVQVVADRIKLLIANPDLCQRVGEDGKRRVWGMLTWGHYAKQMRALYDSILSEKSP
jgi:phosphatidylinositol alpha-1,6-mannosyltransferase